MGKRRRRRERCMSAEEHRIDNQGQSSSVNCNREPSRSTGSTIKVNQGQSSVIKGHQWQSMAIKRHQGAPDRPIARGLARWQSSVINGNQWQSSVIKEHRIHPSLEGWPDGNQASSMAINGNQAPSRSTGSTHRSRAGQMATPCGGSIGRGAVSGIGGGAAAAGVCARYGACACA